MSYSFQLYHPTVRERTRQGNELDTFEHPRLETAAVSEFVNGLAQYGYKLESSTANSRHFVKSVGGCPIQVGVYESEIAFSIPYWKNSEDAIFEALQDASELADFEHMAMFNPQDDVWADV